MRKLLRPTDVLLLGIAGVLDIFEEVRTVFGITEEIYKSCYGWVPRNMKKERFPFNIITEKEMG